jgi:hypothetical protein
MICHHMQNGSASSVVRTTCFACGKRQKFLHRNLKPLNRSTSKSAQMIALPTKPPVKKGSVWLTIGGPTQFFVKCNTFVNIFLCFILFVSCKCAQPKPLGRLRQSTRLTTWSHARKCCGGFHQYISESVVLSPVNARFWVQEYRFPV